MAIIVCNLLSRIYGRCCPYNADIPNAIKRCDLEFQQKVLKQLKVFTCFWQYLRCNDDCSDSLLGRLLLPTEGSPQGDHLPLPFLLFHMHCMNSSVNDEGQDWPKSKFHLCQKSFPLEAKIQQFAVGQWCKMPWSTAWTFLLPPLTPHWELKHELGYVIFSNAFI